jgi:hypothetical protein
MGGFISLIHPKPPSGVTDRCRELHLPAVPENQTPERPDHPSAKILGLKKLPVVEVSAIFQAEACQKVIPIKPHGFSQGLGAFGTALYQRMIVPLAFRQMLTELMGIHPDLTAPLQADFLPFNLYPPLTQSFVEGRKSLTKGSLGVPLVILRPEESDQGISSMAFARNRQVAQESDGLVSFHFSR